MTDHGNTWTGGEPWSTYERVPADIDVFLANTIVPHTLGRKTQNWYLFFGPKEQDGKWLVTVTDPEKAPLAWIECPTEESAHEFIFSCLLGEIDPLSDDLLEDGDA